VLLLEHAGEQVMNGGFSAPGAADDGIFFSRAMY